MFQCSRCAFKAILTSEIENHLKSHHWILADKDVKAALTNVKAVKVLNPAFKDTEGYYFESPDTEKEGECSLSNSENKPSEQASNESESTSENEMPKTVVKWKSNMTCPICKCDSRTYNSWTAYCQHWKMVHEQRYLKTHACPKCSYQSGQRCYIINHMEHCHSLEGRELKRAADEIAFVDVENPSFIDPGNYTCDWFGKSSESENSSTTASSEIGKIVVSCRTLPRITEGPKWPSVLKPSPLPIPASKHMSVLIRVSGSANVEASLQKKATEPAQKEQISLKKFKFAPGMPCPVKNCSPVRITSYSAFVEHWNERHALMLKKFACTVCDFKHIKKSIIFMHVRKEHGMPSHAVTKKITTVMETNVKAEELCELEMPTDHSRSIIMVKPDDSGQFDTNGGKIKEATDVVEELKKSDENIVKLDEQKDESEKDETEGQMHEDTCSGLRDEKKPLESTQLADVNRENVLTNNTAQRVYKSSDKDIKLRMSASENQEKKEASLQKKAREPAEKEQRYPNKLTFVPGMPCPVKNCSPAWISSYSILEHHWNERHGLTLKKFACTLCDFKDVQKSIVFMHVRIEHSIASHVAAAKITTVMVPNSQYVDADELYFPEFPTEDRKLIIMVKPDDSGKETKIQSKDTDNPDAPKDEMCVKPETSREDLLEVDKQEDMVLGEEEQGDLDKKMEKNMEKSGYEEKGMGLEGHKESIHKTKDTSLGENQAIVNENVDSTCDTDGGKVIEKTEMVEELEKSDENIGKIDEQLIKTLHATENLSKIDASGKEKGDQISKIANKIIQQKVEERVKQGEANGKNIDETVQQRKDVTLENPEKDESKERMHQDAYSELKDKKKPSESTLEADVNREDVLTSDTKQRVNKSNDDIKSGMPPPKNQEKKEMGVFGEVLPDSSAEQPTLIEKVQMEANPLVSPKDIEDMIEKEKHSVKGRVESTKDEVQTVMPSGSSNVPKIVADDEDDSLTVDMSEFICIDEIGGEDAEANEESPEKQSAMEMELPGDQEYEIQDEVSSPTEDDQIEDFLQYFICIDDIGDEEGSEGC